MTLLEERRRNAAEEQNGKSLLGWDKFMKVQETKQKQEK